MLLRIFLTSLILCGSSLYAQTVPITAPGEIFWSQPLETLAPGVGSISYIGMSDNNLYFMENVPSETKKGNGTNTLVIFTRALKLVKTHSFTPEWPEGSEFGVSCHFMLIKGKLLMVGAALDKARLLKVIYTGAMDLKKLTPTLALTEKSSIPVEKPYTFESTYSRYVSAYVSPDSSKVGVIDLEGQYLLMNGTLDGVLANKNFDIAAALKAKGKKMNCFGVTGTGLMSQDLWSKGPRTFMDNAGNFYAVATLEGASKKERIPALIRVEQMGSKVEFTEFAAIPAKSAYDYFTLMFDPRGGDGVIVTGYHDDGAENVTVWYSPQTAGKKLTNQVVSVPFPPVMMEAMVKRLDPFAVDHLGSPFHFARPSAVFAESTGELTFVYKQEMVRRQESSSTYQMQPYEGSVIFCTFAAGGAASISRCTAVGRYCTRFPGMTTSVLAGKNDQYLVIYSGIDKQFTQPATFSVRKDYAMLTAKPMMTGTALVAKGKEPVIRAGKTHEAISVYMTSEEGVLPGDQVLIWGSSSKTNVKRLGLVGLPK